MSTWCTPTPDRRSWCGPDNEPRVVGRSIAPDTCICSPFVLSCKSTSRAPEMTYPSRSDFNLPPTSRQLSYARSLAAKAHVALPPEHASDRRVLSRWIADQAARVAESRGRPSSKQVAFAERIARVKRRSVPDECFRDRSLMSKWIDSNKL